MLKLRVWTLVLALWAMLSGAASLCAQTPTPPAKKAVGAATVRRFSAEQYREFLRQQDQRFARIEARAPRDVTGVLKALSQPFSVRRSDGATQNVSGGFWSETLQLGTNLQNVPSREVRKLRRDLQAQISAFDDWNRPRDGAYYLPADAKTIVSQLERNGEIRTGPYGWQQVVANARAWLGDAWNAFLKWLEGLMPRNTAPAPTNVPDMSWLWPVFWVVVVGALLAIFFFIFRALGGAQWLASRRRPKSKIELEGEDAQLLKLPAEELCERASRYAAQGDFREALRHRFLAILVVFDARGVWNYDLRRTNWEHIAALRKTETHRAFVAPLSSLTRRFDRVRYGGAPCESLEWQQFEADAQSLENQLPRTVQDAKSAKNSRREEVAAR